MFRLLLVTARLRDDTEKNFYLKTDATDRDVIEAQALTVMPAVIPEYKEVSHIAMFETAFLFMTPCNEVSL